MSKLKLKQVVVVEGRYDACAIANLVDAIIITTNGFSIFSSNEKKELIRTLGKRQGLIILTDSDAAGFKIRNYVEKIAGDCEILHAYIPAVKGKESRKQAPSKEGTLGVEGLSREVLERALQLAQAEAVQSTQSAEFKPADLYFWGLSGQEGSAKKRRKLLQSLNLPPRLSTNALCKVLSVLYTYEEFNKIVSDFIV